MKWLKDFVMAIPVKIAETHTKAVFYTRGVPTPICALCIFAAMMAGLWVGAYVGGMQ